MKIYISLLLLVYAVFHGYGQTVQGIITDESNIPLSGVTVLLKDSNTGVISDIDGLYSIKASIGDFLTFSFIGMKTTTVEITSTILNVVLLEDFATLEEVVVTSFGIKKKEKSLGYAVQKVDSDDISLIGNTNSLVALQGQVAGLQLNKISGEAGGGVEILIRGVTSISPSRNNQPLIIVDGVIINNDTFTGSILPSDGSNSTGSSEQFNFASRSIDINPDDIETYTILKGAAASALYGQQASNGAILITTKKGKIGTPKIKLSSSVTFRSVDKVPESQSIYREGNRRRDNAVSFLPGALYDVTLPTGYLQTDVPTFWSWGLPYSQISTDVPIGGVDTTLDLSNDRFYDPWKTFHRAGVNRQVNLSISGADTKFDYYFSAGNSFDEGVVPNTLYKKINLRAKMGYKTSDKFSVNSSIAYTKSRGRRANGGDRSIYSSLSYWTPTFPINDYVNPDDSQRKYTGIIDNPRYVAENATLNDDVNRWLGNIEFNWAPEDWMSITYRAQIDNYSDQRNRFVRPNIEAGSRVGGFLTDENINFTGLESNLLVTFTKEFSEDFNASLLVGNQVTDSQRDYVLIRGEGLNIPTLNIISNASTFFSFNNVIKQRNVGLFADLRLEYQDKLFLSITGRNDWDSTLPSQNKSFFYPSISASYVFSEDLFKESDIISFGKLRTSWAQVGKGVTPGTLGSFFEPDPNFPFNGSGGFIRDNRAGDPDLKPEISNTIEIGADLRFFNNKFRLDYSYYKSNVTDQIFDVPTPQSSGISSFIRNAGEFETTGHEILVSATILNNDNLKWNASLNWSTNKGIVVDLPEDISELIVRSDSRLSAKLREGDKIGALYGWVFQTAPDGQRVVGDNGLWIVTGDKNSGFFFANGNQQVKVGNAMPDYIMSLNNNFSWKNLSFNFLLEYKSGGDLYDIGLRNGIRNGNLQQTVERGFNTVLPGVVDDGSGNYTPNTTQVTIGSSYYRNSSSYNSASEIILQDASWVKLRNISLSYKFDKSVVEKINLDNASLTFGVSNILIWTPFKGIDPETSQYSAGSNIFGFTGLTTPLTVDYSFKFKLEF